MFREIPLTPLLAGRGRGAGGGLARRDEDGPARGGPSRGRLRAAAAGGAGPAAGDREPGGRHPALRAHLRRALLSPAQGTHAQVGTQYFGGVTTKIFI